MTKLKREKKKTKRHLDKKRHAHAQTHKKWGWGKFCNVHAEDRLRGDKERGHVERLKENFRHLFTVFFSGCRRICQQHRVLGRTSAFKRALKHLSSGVYHCVS